MKKVFLISVFFIAAFKGFAQGPETFTAIKELIRIQFPHVNTEGKLISVNIWSPSDHESRACNQAFEHAYNTFKDAKLKGGEKGMLIVLLIKDKLDPSVIALLKKDGIQCALVYYMYDVGNPIFFEFKNAVFDANGLPILKNLYSDNIFNSIQSLITR